MKTHLNEYVINNFGRIKINHLYLNIMFHMICMVINMNTEKIRLGYNIYKNNNKQITLR